VSKTAWRIRLTRPAENDLRHINWETLRSFGEAQAITYRSLLMDGLKAIAGDPFNSLSRARDDLVTGVRFYHIRRTGQNARHFIVYRVVEPHLIEVLRVLYDGMDFANQLKPDP
jgi:plasmid stabilization system protein ParE